jgi:predicted nucleotidyltransferase component of viral defense system
VTKRPSRNIAASIHQRLKNVARDTDRPFDEVLQYFTMERFLHRLSISKHADSFVLKGALLFRVWYAPDSRATRDIDFLAYMNNAPGHLASMVRDIISIDGPDDGVIFDPDSVEAQRTKEGADYEGVRTRFIGHLGNARITMQVDTGFGDSIYPAPALIDYPTILDFPAPSLRAYPPETVIAEKVEAMIYLGRLNSRMKDFYDIWWMAQQLDFDGATLYEAIRQTLETRGTDVIQFDELRPEILENQSLEKQWSAFVRKSRIEAPASFAEILLPIEAFLAPLLSALKNDEETTVDGWDAPGPWNTK